MRILQIVLDHGDHFNDINTAMALHRLAKHRPPQMLMHSMVEHAGFRLLMTILDGHIGSMQPRTLSNALWAFATLKLRPAQTVLNAAAARAVVLAPVGVSVK